MIQSVNKDFGEELPITKNLNISDFYRQLCQVQIPIWNP